MKLSKSLIVVAISAAVAIGRFTIPGHGLSYAGGYEALAHIAVGLIIATAYFCKESRWLAVGCVIVITLLETVMFIIRGAT